MKNEPELLVSWDPAWQSFVSSVSAVLAPRPHGPAPAVVPSGIRLRSPLVSILLHGVILSAWIGLLSVLPPSQKMDRPPASSREVIYYLSPQPAIRSAEGAETGRSGDVGEREHYDRTQAIRIARGKKQVETVVDAPTLRLPPTRERVADLLAFTKALPTVPVADSPNPVRAAQLSEAPPASAPSREPKAPAAPSLSILLLTRPEVSAADPKLTLAMKGGSPTPIPESLHNPATAKPLPNGGLAAAPPPPREGQVAVTASNASGGIGAKGTTSDLVISAETGERIGIPEGGTGSLAMSVRGVGRGGLQGSTAGSGTAPRPATGSERLGGNGSGSSGAAAGSTPQAHEGISPNMGAGGTGGSAGRAAMAGVTIRGGVVYVPSFSGGASSNASAVEQGQPPAIVVISTARAGGLLDPTLGTGGGRVYTTYFETTHGTVVLQFADPAVAPGFEADLTVPQFLHTDFPSDIRMKFTVVACAMDRFGALSNLQIVRTADSSLVPKLLEALKGWKFRPALRGDRPVEITMALGFATNTR